MAAIRSSSPRCPTVQKAKLVERIAELLSEKKLPLLGDVRDESAEKSGWCWSRRPEPSTPSC